MLRAIAAIGDNNSNTPKPHRFGCEATDKWKFKSNKTFLFAHVKYWPMKPKFYNH